MAKKINIDVNLRDEEAKKKLKNLQEGKYKVDMDVNADGINQTTKGMNRLSTSTKNTNTVFGKLKNTISNTFSGGKLAMTGYLAVLRSINLASKNAKQSIEELDKSVTDLSVATNMSRKATYDLLGQYNNMAKQLSSTTTQISSAADDYLRAGKSMNEANKLIQDSIMLSKLGQITSGEATEDLLATMNGFNMTVNQVNDALDAMVAIDMAAATSSGDIATALKYCASSADVAGVSFNKLAAMIGTVQDKTQQSAETVGTFMNTLLSRYRNVKIGQFVDDDGQDLSDVETILNSVGIKLRETNQEFRDFETVIDEVAKSWNNYSGVQQAAIAKAFSGSRQQNRFIALMEGYNKTLELTEVAANSAGTAIEKFNNSYQNSLEAKQNTLQSTFESAVLNSDMQSVYGDILDATTALVKFIDETNALKGALSGLIAFGGIKAFISIKAGAIEAYTELNKFTNAMNIASKTNISTTQFEKLLLLSDGLSKKQMKLVLSTNSLTVAQKKQLLMASGLSEEESIAALQAWKMSAANNGLTASTTSTSNAFKGLWLTLKANPLILLTSAITIGVSAWQRYKQSAEEARQSAVETANTYSETADSISEYIKRYQELHAALLEAKGNEEERTSVKSQLLDLQKELNEQFGDEYGKLNLVTDAYKDQTEAIKAYAKASAETFLNDPDNRKQFEKAESKMTKERTYNLSDYGMIGGTKENNALIDIANSFSDRGVNVVDEFGDGSYSQFSIRIEGVDAQQAYDTINDFESAVRQKAKELGDEHLFDSVLDISGNAYKEAESVVDKWGDIYQKGLLAQIADDDKLSADMNNAIDAVQKYNDAVSNSENPYNDENVKSTYEDLQKIKETISDNFAWDNYRNIIDNTFAEADTGAYEFRQNLDKNVDGIKDCANQLKGLSETDLQAMLDSGDNDAFNKLTASAEEFGTSAEDVISILKQIGIVTEQIADTAADAAEKLSFTDTLAQVQALSEGLDQLDKIYADVYNKEDFDWSSILNNDGFKEAFGELGSSYDNFIKTISESPDNLSACQSAFDKLSTEYIYNSDVMKNLTEETKAGTVAMLEQMGVANASEMVEARLAAQKYATANGCIDLANATWEEISALVAEGSASQETQQYLANLALSKIDVNNIKLDTKADVDNIIAIANAAGASAAQIDALKRALASLSNANITKWSDATKGAGGMGSINLMNPAKQNKISSGNSKIDAFAQQQQAQKAQNAVQDATDALAKTLDDIKNGAYNLDASDFYAKYNGGSATKKAVNDAAKAAKDAAKDVKEAVAETFDFIENGINRFDKALSKLEDKAGKTSSSFTSRLNAYKEALNATTFGIELLTDDYNKYMQKANEVGLNEDIASAVRGGASNIWDYTDDTVKQQIKDYQSWYDKAQDCLDKIDELKDKQLELTQASIELLITQYEKLATKIENVNDRTEKWISLKESWGFSASTKNYDSMNKNIQKQIDYINKQDEQLKLLQKTVAKGSEAWYEYNERIDSNKASLIDLKQQMQENATAAATLAKATADKKTEKYDSQDELYDAKIDNATSAKSKNKLIDKKISNINKTQKAYNTAVSTDNKNLKSAKKTISKFKSTKENKKVLASIKKAAKAGKRISQSLLDKASKLNDNGKLYNACVQYNAYWDAKEADKATADLYKETSKQDKADLAKQKFDNIADQYDYETSGNEQKKTSINNKISLAEEQGRKISTAYYDGLISAESAEQQKLIAKRNALQQSLNEAVMNGSIEEGSDEWYDMVSAINDVTNAIDDATKSLVEYKNAQRQLRWDTFDKSLETIKRINSEADYYIDLLSHKDMTDKDTGNFTEYGTATIGLHKTNYDNYIAQAEAYQNEYNNIMEQIRKGELSASDENVIQRLRDLQDAHRDAKKSAEDELQSIQDLVKQGYEAQTDALSKLIDKYKKLKDSELEAYKYQKEIAEKTKTIAALQKQLTAYNGNDSEESRAQIQKLKVELQDAKNDLKDTQYEKFISDTEDMLDDLMSDYQEFIDEKLNDTNNILNNISSLLGDSGNIVATLKSLDSNLTSKLESLITGGTSAVDNNVTNTIATDQNAINTPADTSGYDAAEAAKQAEAEKKRQAEIQKVNEQRANLNAQIAETDNQLSQLQAELNAAKAEYNASKSGVKNKKKLAALKAEYTNKTEEIRARISELQNNKTVLSDQLNSLPKYAKGSEYIDKKGLVWTQDGGGEMIYRSSDGAMLTPVNVGDKVFTNEMSENLWKMAQMNPAQLCITSQISKIPNFTRDTTSNIEVNFGDLVLPDVTNSSEFADSVESVIRNAICKNGKTTQCITEAVSAKQLGKNSIGNARLYK